MIPAEGGFKGERTSIKGELTMKRYQPKGTLNKRYQPEVDFKGKETSRRGIFNKEYYVGGRFLRKERRSKANFQLKRDQPKWTLNKRYQSKVDLKGATEDGLQDKETSRKGIFYKEYYTKVDS